MELTPEEWANCYNIYAFKIPSSTSGTLRSSAPLWAARLEIRFSVQSPATISDLILHNIVARLKLIKIRTLFP